MAKMYEVRTIENKDLQVTCRVNDYGFSNKLTRKIGKFVEKISRPVWEKVVKKSKDIQVYFNHKPSETLAEKVNLRCEDDGVYADVTLKESARHIYNGVKSGKIKEMSFGFRVLDETREDGINFFKRYIKDFLLFEISLLSVRGAYPNTSIVSCRGLDEDMEIEIRGAEHIRPRTDLERKRIMRMLEL